MVKMIKKAFSWYINNAFESNAFMPSCMIPIKFLNNSQK